MNATPAILYQCPVCGELYDDDYDAKRCCPNEAERVTVWKCGNCDTTYDEQDHARTCCWDGETDLEPYRPTPQELEIAGQQRLPL